MINMLKIQLRSKQAPLLALVSCLTMQIGAPQNVAAQLANNSLIPQAESNVRIERKVRGIPAELVDAGDYYFRPDGSKVKMLRKKDVFVVKADPTKRKRAMQRFKARYGDRVKEIRKHRLGGANVVRLDNRTTTKARKQQSFDIQPQMLEALDNSVSDMVPVFAGVRGQGDLLLLPKVTVKIDQNADVQVVLARLKTKYGLSVDRKLRVSGHVYSLEILDLNASQGQQFATVRSVMNEANVTWAEPQFYSKPYKTVFEPTSNPLYVNQWHLQNRGFRGSRCDADCDANNAWDIDSDGVGGADGGAGAVAGDGMVIAILDDGVDLNHEDLDIWTNPNIASDLGNDEDNSGCANDLNGCDFVIDPNTTLQNPALEGADTCVGGDDGSPGVDGDPSPQPVTNCFTIQGDPVEQDDHGTAVAGLAAAIGDDISSIDVGVVGTAFRAQILPVRIISDFDAPNPTSFCNRVAEATEYAGRHADVLNNSWGTDDQCAALQTALTNVAAGTVMDDAINVSKRKSTDTGAGSPIVFASGNSASGWVKVTVSVPAGEHAYEWRYYRTDPADLFDEFNIDEAVWLDDINFPDGSFEGFEDFASISGSFTNDHTFNKCDEFCELGDESAVDWIENTDLAKVRSGSASATVDMLGAECTYTYLHTIKEHSGTEDISFWVWVSTNTADADKFEFLVDGKKRLTYSDIASAGFVDNAVGYPARLSASIDGVIAVGASTSGDLSGITTAALIAEERASYSQFGPTLDLLAPSGDQHLGVFTTDRTGTAGYNVDRDIGGSAAADPNYTDDFGGTSAAAPMVAGVAAAIIAIDGDLDASEVRDILRDTADKIGRNGASAYVAGRNNEYGYGRLNMLNALESAAGISTTDPVASCSADLFDYDVDNDLILPAYSPVGGIPTCPAQGPVPDNELCLPIKAVNGNIAVICL